MVEASKIDYKSFDVAALNALRNADWPGDLDELESVVQNLLMTSLGDTITQEDVQRVLKDFQGQITESVEQHMPLNLDQPLREARDEFERFYFQYHMRLVKNNMSRLSDISGLERTHLYRKLKQLGIRIKG
jgi:two-component system, NtrC family, nitrogen regulation response regulator NtrX